MAQLKFGSAGVTAREIDLSGPVAQEPVGVPAGVIGTALRGPAFVPITVGLASDFYAKFGKTDGKKFGPLAVSEWLRNASAVTYLRVLGVGTGLKRAADGSVASAGFTVGEEQPNAYTGALSANPYANANGVPGRTYFLGAFMSESAGSTVFSDAGIQTSMSASTILRGVLMAPSGVILKLSSSVVASAAPSSTAIGVEGSVQGSTLGAVTLLDGTVSKSEFVLLLNGHKGTDASYPNVITASLDMSAPNYFANVLNTDPLKIQQAGHYLYANWDVHSAVAVVTGSGVVSGTLGAGAATSFVGKEHAVLLATSSLARNVGSTTVPNYEGWTDRFAHSRSPWVISQKFGGVATNLFRLHALDAGAGTSTNYKLSIENLVPSTDPQNRYGSFDLIIREWDDLDTSVRALEQWRGVNLDPSSDRYIAKVIGDTHVFYDFDQVESSQKLVVEGSYPNKSNYVRVEVSTDVENQTVDATALPFGVRGAFHLVTSGSAPLANVSSTQLFKSTALLDLVQPPVPMRKNITQGAGSKAAASPQLYWGAKFEHATSTSTPNASTLKDESLVSFAKYFPDFAETNQNFLVGDNNGTVDTAANGVLDADRFCNNLFTLENVKVTTGSNGLADSTKWADAVYVRNGNITADDSAKTRKVTADDLVQANRRYLKYTFFMQGGFDGVNLFDNEESTLSNKAVTADMDDANRGRNLGPTVKAYSKALDIMKNTVNADVQLLAIPGLRHPIITDAAISATEERFDALYIMDIEEYDQTNNLVTGSAQLISVQNTVDNFRDRALDTSFAAAYFPDVTIPDPNVSSNVQVPPSVVVLGALALNDAVGHPWFAPAGMARGALQTTLEAKVQLSKGNMDTLYDVSINPLVAFPGNTSSGTNPKGGVVVWGQKTLQAAASALDRVNVRRLLIDIRRQTREIAQTIIFEPNREATLAKFSAAITPRLQRIQALAGLERFKVVIDSSTTTQADIENNTIRGKIFVQPTKSVEFVTLDFVVTNNITQG